MKDVVPDEGIPAKLNLYFSDLYLFSMNFQTLGMDKYNSSGKASS